MQRRVCRVFRAGARLLYVMSVRAMIAGAVKFHQVVPGLPSLMLEKEMLGRFLAFFGRRCCRFHCQV